VDIKNYKHNIDRMQVEQEELEQVLSKHSADLIETGILQEVTKCARKYAEDELQDIKYFLFDLLNEANISLYLFSSDLCTAYYVGPGFKKISGYPCEKFYQTPMFWVEAVHPDDRELFLSDIRVNKKKAVERKYRIIHSDGSIKWVQSKCFFSPIKNSNASRVALIVEDLSENKSEECLLHNIIDKLESGVVVLDHDYRIIIANAAYCGSVGMTMNEMRGRKCYEVYQNSELPCSALGKDCPVMRTFATGAANSTVHSYSQHDEYLKSYDVISYPIADTYGNVEFAVEFFNDATERIKLENQLHDAKKKEAISILTGSIVHDISNFLTIISGFAAVLQIKAPNDYLKMKAEHIVTASSKASQLAKGLQITLKRRAADPMALNLNRFLEQQRSYLTGMIHGNIRLSMKLCEEKINIYADYEQMEQILMNLASNARDAMPDGGGLQIELHQAVIDANFVKKHNFGKIGKYALIVVSDTGVGIDERSIVKIFAPFFTTKEIGKGTGLGLSIVYNSVKQHDGFITVDSTVGKGSTFYIYLPLKDEEITKQSKKLISLKDKQLIAKS